MRLNKNAHCFAVEPSGWRFTFDASIFVTLFRRFAPSDSPRVHQWRCQATTPQLYLPFGKSDCFAVIFCFAKLNFHVVKVKANIISLLPTAKNITLAQAKISPPKAISFFQLFVQLQTLFLMRIPFREIATLRSQ